MTTADPGEPAESSSFPYLLQEPGGHTTWDGSKERTSFLQTCAIAVGVSLLVFVALLVAVFQIIYHNTSSDCELDRLNEFGEIAYTQCLTGSENAGAYQVMWAAPFAYAVVLLACLPFIYNKYGKYRGQFQIRQRDEESRRNLNLVTRRIALERGDIRLEFINLSEATEKRLDVYHTMVTTQADKSFRRAQAAAVIGFLVAGGCAVLAAQATETSSTVATAIVGTSATGLAAYVSRVFVRSQESAAGHLHSYFSHPQQLSKYLTAERLLNGLPESDRVDGILAIVRGISGEPEPGPPDAPA